MSKKIVLGVDITTDRAKQGAVKVVSNLHGVDSIAVDVKHGRLIVVGDVDALRVLSALQNAKFAAAHIVSVGPAVELVVEKKPGEINMGMEVQLPPFSASLGAMSSLTRKLHVLLDTELKDEMGGLRTRLLQLSEARDPPVKARIWMKDVRELSYDMENCVDTEADWIDKMSRIFKPRVKAANRRHERYSLASVPNHRNPRLQKVDGWRRQDPTVVVGLHDGPFDTLCHLLADGDEQLKVLSILGVGGIGKTTLAKELWRKHKAGDHFHCRAFVRTARKPDMRRILRSILAQVRPHQPPDASEVHDLIHDLTQHLQDKRYFIIIDDLWAASVWDVATLAFPEGNHGSRIITTTEIEDVALACCSYQSRYIFEMEPLSHSHSKELLTRAVFGSREDKSRKVDEVSAEIIRRCHGLPKALVSISRVLASPWEANTAENREQIQNSLPTDTTPDEKLKHVLLFGKLDEVSDEIIRRCAGLPQSIISISSVLASQGENRVQNMEQILNDLPTNTTPDDIHIFCYNCLPSCLQTCLLYLSLYPQNYIILKEDVMKQWVAEGFISATREKDAMEVAESYFDTLVHMGMIQQIDVNYSEEVLYYAVHSMVHDLITSKSIEENFVTVMDYSQRTVRFCNKVNRLSLQFGSATYATTPSIAGLSQVRSLAFIGLLSCFPSSCEFKLLRVLIIHIWDDVARRSFYLGIIEEALLLRHLQVTANLTIYLPLQMQGLQHLETVEINARVAAIPSDIFQLGSLMHLHLGGGTELPDVTGILKIVNLNPAIPLDESSTAQGSLKTIELCAPICRIPQWFGQLTQLRILKMFVQELGRHDIHVLEGLPALTVLSLNGRNQTDTFVFVPEAFHNLEYFEFRSGIVSMFFLKGAMPNLRRLKLGFNAQIDERCGCSLIGIEQLSNVHEIAGIIGGAAGAEEPHWRAAESEFHDAIRKHPRYPSKISIKTAFDPR